MAFGKKKAEEVTYSQANAGLQVAQALAKTRAIRVRVAVRLILTAPMLHQRWTKKAVTQMLGSMVGMKQPKLNKDLTQDYEDSYYRNVNGVPCFPCRNIKACIVSGYMGTNGAVTGAELRRGLRVVGWTAPLNFKGKPSMDIKIVRNANGGPDVRSRAAFPEGTYLDIVLEFGPPLTPDKVISALEAGGVLIGLGEWRPEKGGDFGTFTVEALKSDAATIDRIVRANTVEEEQFEIPPEMLRAFSAIPPEKLTDQARKVRSNLVNGAASRKNGAAQHTTQDAG